MGSWQPEAAPPDAASAGDAATDGALDAPFVDAEAGGPGDADATAIPDASPTDAPADAGPQDSAAPDANTDAGVAAEAGTEAGAPCDGVDCSHLDSDCARGVCKPGSGLCVARPVTDGTSCSDCPGGACTSCQGGVCESAALLFEDFEDLDSLRDAPGWSFPSPNAALQVDAGDAASGERSLNHSASKEQGIASYAFDEVIDAGVVRVELDVRLAGKDPVDMVQVGLVEAGAEDVLLRDRASLTARPGELIFAPRSNPTYPLATDPVVDAWRRMALEIDFDARRATAFFDGVELYSAPTNYRAFDALVLLLGPGADTLRVDNLQVIHRP